MNKKKLLALLVSSAFLFAACGDDDSPSSPKNSEKEISSSSEDDDCDSDECDEKSSSSKKNEEKSSSSKKDDGKSSSSKSENKDSSDSKSDKSSSSSNDKTASSSSAVSSSSTESSSSALNLPEGLNAAKLKDLDKYIELDLFGQKVILSTGSKQGLISLRIPDELWIITYTDFANGIVKFEKGNVGIQYSDTEAAKTIKNKLEEGFKISFVVDNEGNAKYAVNDSKEYSKAVSTKVSLQSGKISKAEDIKDKVYKCAAGDTTRSFSFYDNSYLVENVVGGKEVSWVAGHYDIQRSTLLMRPVYYNGSVYSMYSYSVGTDKTIVSSDGKSLSCEVNDIANLVYQDAKKYVGDWQTLTDGIEWQFSIKADGTYELTAFKNNGNVEAKNGVWEFYGNQLIMRNKGCLHPDKCTSAIHGVAEMKSNGFDFKHSDPDTPKIPTSFEATQYE